MFFNGNGAAPERNSRIAPGNFVIGFSLACWTQWTFFGVGANEALELHDAGNWLAAVENTVVLFLIGFWLLHAGSWKWTGGILAANLAGERQKFCVHGIIGARQTGASNEHEHQTQFS